MDMNEVARVIGIIGAIIGTLLALLTFMKAVFEYCRQGSQKRAEFFSKMRNSLWLNEKYQKICGLLDEDIENSKLKEIPVEDKLAFLTYFEEIALMMYSSLIKKDVAHYIFGYYAIRCWDSNIFWENSGQDKNGIYWAVFRDFVKKMKKIESEFKFEPKRLKF